MPIKLPYRLHQVARIASGAKTSEPELPADAVNRLTDPMLHQFRILPAIDQHHLLRTYALLTEKGANDDTITAGLIHDVGKACANCRITIVDRGLHVILNRIAPGPYRRFASIESAPAPVRGLHRLANHAERGALAASQAGYKARVIELVRYHESGGTRIDEQLQLLRAADHQAGLG
jgi:hypothetical protein